MGSNIAEDLSLDLPAISYGFIRGITADAIVIVDLAGSEHGLKPLEPLYQINADKRNCHGPSRKGVPRAYAREDLAKSKERLTGELGNTSLHYPPSNIEVCPARTPVCPARAHYKADLKLQPEFLCVFNIFRPLTNTKEKMLTYLDKVNSLTPWRITGLVNNSNLLQDTDSDHILQGQELLLTISKERDIPLRFTQLKRTIYQQIHHQIQSEQVILFDELQMREKWQ